jgi:hypothetical protein
MHAKVAPLSDLRSGPVTKDHTPPSRMAEVKVTDWLRDDPQTMEEGDA